MLSEEEERKVTLYFRKLFFTFVLFAPFILLWAVVMFGLAMLIKR